MCICQSTMLLNSEPDNIKIIAVSNKEQVYISMVNWKITATTIYCDAVGDEVTLMVYKDGAVKCTGYKKYYETSRETMNLVKERSKQLNRKLECEGPRCCRAIQYRDKLFADEGAPESPSKETVVSDRGREVVREE